MPDARSRLIRAPAPLAGRAAHVALLLFALLPLAVGIGPAVARAHADEIEEVEEVEPVKAHAPTAAPASGSVIGRLHPLLVHFPIAWLMLLLLVDGVALVLRRDRWTAAGIWLLGLAVLACIPTVVTGLMRADHLAPGAEAARVARMLTHRNLALVGSGLGAVALVLRLLRRNRLEGAWRMLYLVVVLGAVAVVAIAGHLGGELVYGEDHFPF